MRILVAMSGGVDSSVAAALLAEGGQEIVGVHMKLHGENAPITQGASKTCCGLDDANDARSVSSVWGFPFYVMNLSSQFNDLVIENFKKTWKLGGTPSPCTQCNGEIKFKILLDRARALGCSHVATGHYALRRAHLDGTFSLWVSDDRDKDQTYFLWNIKRLDSVLFPLGSLTKSEVREQAHRLQLSVADKRESQEICFIPGSDYKLWLKEKSPDEIVEGDIVDLNGKILGRHNGYWNFTIGQKKGLSLHGYWVHEIDPISKRVIVGNEPPQTSQISLKNCNFYVQPHLFDRDNVLVRTRHRAPMVHARVILHTPLETVLEFSSPQRAVSWGQSAVLYREHTFENSTGIQVLGGGIVSK